MENSEQTTTQTTANTQGQTQAPAVDNAQNQNTETEQQVVSTEQSNQQSNQEAEQENSALKDFADSLNVDEQEQAKEPEQQQETAPEHYVLKNANGEDVEPQELEMMSRMFKDVNLSQEQAQKLYSAYEKEQGSFIEQSQKAFNQMRDDWFNQTISDPQLGGQNIGQTKLCIKRVMQQCGNKELSEFLNKTGLGFNPAMVRFMTKVGELLGNDNHFVQGQAPVVINPLKARYKNSPELFK
jgi:hypothetical protein